MNNDELIKKCYDVHLSDLGEQVTFTFEEYESFWKNHFFGKKYSMKNRSGPDVDCSVAYYPLPYYKDLRALIEMPMKDGGTDYREVPIMYLKTKQ